MNEQIYQLAHLGQDPASIANLLNISLEDLQKNYHADLQRGYTKSFTKRGSLTVEEKRKRKTENNRRWLNNVRKKASRGDAHALMVLQKIKERDRNCKLRKQKENPEKYKEEARRKNKKSYQKMKDGLAVGDPIAIARLEGYKRRSLEYRLRQKEKL